MKLSKSDIEMYAAMEMADTLRSVRTYLEAHPQEKTASVLYEIRAEEDKAQIRAWSKMIKKYPGVCRYLYGSRTEKLKKDLKRFSDATKALDEKTEKGRKAAVKSLIGLIISIAGLGTTGVIANFAAPWVVDAGWAILKFQFRQYKRLFMWLKKNIEETGNIKELREECQKAKPKVPSKVKRYIQENKK